MLNKFKNRHLLSRILCLIFGSFIITFVYNKFLVENDIVVGGLSGLAIVIQQAFGISTTLFINVGNVLLVILSFIICKKIKTF